jgi:hypothetical protein
MHDVLRQRLMRKIESLPEEQVYQVLDYIEFLESKYARNLQVEATGLQRFAEGLEDRLRKKAMSPHTLREAFQLIAAADRVLSSVSSAGRQIINELGTVAEGPAEIRPGEPPTEGRTGMPAGSRAEGRTQGRTPPRAPPGPSSPQRSPRLVEGEGGGEPPSQG